MTTVSTSSAGSPARPEIHGHRGCRGLLPENTLPAFEYAVALGVDVLEMDVVIAADGQVVVSHEPWFSAAICRLPSGQPIAPEQELAHNIYCLSYPQIQQYDCGLTPHPRFPGQHNLPACKPLLRDVISSVEALVKRLGRPPMRYSIELKTEPNGDNIFHPHPDAFVPLVLAVLRQLAVQVRVTLLSFDPRILRVARALSPAIPLCMLVEDERPLAEHLAVLGFVPDVFGPDYRLLTPALLHEAQAHGMRIVPWTVNDASIMRELIRAGVSGITTDYPDVLQAVLAEQS